MGVDCIGQGWFIVIFKKRKSFGGLHKKGGILILHSGLAVAFTAWTSERCTRHGFMTVCFASCPCNAVCILCTLFLKDASLSNLTVFRLLVDTVWQSVSLIQTET